MASVGEDAAARYGKPLFFVLLLAVSLFPLTLSAPLPMADYPNHLARTYIIANLDTSPYLSRYYDIVWGLIPNMAIDMIVPVMALVMPIELAGKLFVAAILVLTATGAMAIHRQLFGRWSLFPFAVFLLLYHRTMLWGFVNYMFTAALALWLFAAWLRWRQINVYARLALFGVLTTALFPLHLYGLAFYAVLVGGYEISRAWFSHRREGAAVLVTLVVNALPFVPSMALMLLSPTAAGGATVWGDLRGKLIGLGDPFNLYSLPFDIFTAVALGALFAIGLLTRRLVVQRDMVLPVVLLAAIYFALPIALLGSVADRRLVGLLLIMLVASTDWRVQHATWRRALVLALTMLFIVRMAVIAANWSRAGDFYAEVRDAIGLMQPGTRLAVVYAVRREPRLDNPPREHIGAMAVIDRDAYVNVLFADKHYGILRTRYDGPAAHDCCIHVLSETAIADTARDDFAKVPLGDFDYVITLGLDLLRGTPPTALVELRRSSRLAFYRVEHRGQDGGRRTDE